MKTKQFFLLLLFFGVSWYGHSQAVYFVQFKINSVSDAEEATVIDNKIASKKGVISSRTDHVTSTYFCSISTENDYTIEDFSSWFKKLGYEISCYNSGSYGNTEMISPHDLKKCEENNSP